MFKKALLFLSAGLLIVGLNVNAAESDAFKVDKQQIQNEFTDLNALEQTVIDNNNMSLTELQQNNLLPDNFSAMNFTNTNMMMEPPLGIPGFWWGCVLGVVGVLIVYFLSEKDKAETKQALIGCLVATGVIILWQVFWYAIYGSSYLW